MKLTYLLPTYGGNGGSNSVVYDAIELREMGLDVSIVAPDYCELELTRNYHSVWNFHDLFCFYDSTSEIDLKNLLVNSTHVVATIWTSVELALRFSNCSSKLFYFVQDYEPFFYEEGSHEYVAAASTYNETAFVMFAKSSRVISLVEDHHGVTPKRVAPSILTSSFFPNLKRDLDRKTKLGFMLRPETFFRNAEGVARVAEMVQENVDCDLASFGCDVQTGMSLFSPDTRVYHCGKLAFNDVPDLLRSCDLFLDLSLHQGFGRLGLEAVACGCVSVLPKVSGLHDILKDGEDCVFADYHDEQGVANWLSTMVLDAASRRVMAMKGAARASVLSSRAAALSAMSVFLS